MNSTIIRSIFSVLIVALAATPAVAKKNLRASTDGHADTQSKMVDSFRDYVKEHVNVDEADHVDAKGNDADADGDEWNWEDWNPNRTAEHHGCTAAGHMLPVGQPCSYCCSKYCNSNLAGQC